MDFFYYYLFSFVAVCIVRRWCHSPRKRQRQKKTQIHEYKYRHRSQRVAVQFCNSHGHKRQFCIRNGNL